VTKKRKKNIEEYINVFWCGREILNTYQIGKKKNIYIYISDRIINTLIIYHLAPSLTTGTTIGAGTGKFCGSNDLK
jgi:hypothetical protein